jgi:anaerobic magnesium-protoporphyrin IX monomethyl ester cyclase
MGEIMNFVLLVFPKASEEQINFISPPLSILYVGSYLEKEGINVTYIDLRIQTMEDLINELKKEPLAVGISSMTGFQLIGTLEILRLTKTISPNSFTILGGVHSSILPQQTLENDLVDFIVIGEGEITMLKLISELKKETKDLTKIHGIGWKKKGAIIINSLRPFMNLKNQIPPITELSKNLYKNYPTVKVQVSRGCPHRCGFCYNTVFNRRKYREKPIKTIENEINVIKNFIPSVKHITLLADEIGFNNERIEDLGKLMSKYDYTFHSAIRAEHVTEKLIEIIEDHCEEFLIGVESVVPRIRKLIHKDNDIEDVRRASKLLSKSKIRVVWSFMTAFPGETKEETISNMNFADELKDNDSRSIITPFFITTPYPGTDLFNLAKEYGYKSPNSLIEWKNFGLGKISMPWVDKNNEYFSDLYGISFLLYTPEESYQKTKLEKEWFLNLKKIAKNKWDTRDLNFKEEWNEFLLYNREKNYD